MIIVLAVIGIKTQMVIITSESLGIMHHRILKGKQRRLVITAQRIQHRQFPDQLQRNLLVFIQQTLYLQARLIISRFQPPPDHTQKTLFKRLYPGRAQRQTSRLMMTAKLQQQFAALVQSTVQIQGRDTAAAAFSSLAVNTDQNRRQMIFIHQP